MNDGPFTDKTMRDWIEVVRTQHGIVKYAEAMAQVLAQAGLASQKAIGDNPHTAVSKWSALILSRAHDIIRDSEKPPEVQQETVA